MNGRSTSSNLLEFLHYSIKALNTNKQVDVLYTDFSKAFDVVDHSILVSKLDNFGLPVNLIEWLKSYLSNRRQYVNYGHVQSNKYVVNSGVPQGSHLGPILFLLFINDIVSAAGEYVFISLFADDLKMAVSIETINDTNKLQMAINNLKSWCDINKLHLNLDKCSIMSISKKRDQIIRNYSFGNHLFQRVSDHRDLGVIFDNKLNFVKHIDSIEY